MTKAVAKNDQWSQYAEDYASKEEVPSSQFISTQGGSFSLGDEKLGKEMCVVVADAVREYLYYEGRYNPSSPQPPRCYAFGRSEEEMVPGLFIDGDDERDLFAEKDPEEQWFVPQAEACSECPKAEWGTSDTGRGKACKQQRRLSLIPAGVFVKNKKTKETELELFEDKADFEEVDMAYVKVPVTSVKHWARFVKEVAAMSRPPFGVFTRIYMEESAENQFEMRFELIEEVPDDLMGVVLKRHKEARASIAQPYRPPEEGSAQGVRGLKKKASR